ncbi:MAG: hypothetical protein ACM30H_09365 [Clostridia bacterium]
MMAVIQVVYLPFVAFMEWPALALLPAGVFGALFWRRRRFFILATAVLWALYGAYEAGMKLRILCGGECNIRVDLIFLAPFFWVVSIVALGFFFRRGKAADGAA